MSFTVAHVRVILRRNPANDVVAANVYLLGGTRAVTARTAGIETLMLAASGEGTRRFPKRELEGITARTGASVSITPGVDWTSFGLRTLRQTFDSSWAVFADRLVEPTLDSTQVERARRELLTEALERDADPDNAVEDLADSLLYASHPYQLHPSGSPASLRAVSFRTVRAFHDTAVTQTRLLVVVVGNIGRTRLEAAVRRTLTKLPVGAFTWTNPPMLTPADARLAAEQRSLPTNYVLGLYAGPRAGTTDYYALEVACAVLGGRLFADVRTRRDLAYAVDAPFTGQAVSVGGLYVTTTNPAAALQAMVEDVHELQSSRVDSAGLQTLIRGFATEYFLKNETDADQADALARAQLFEGDYRAAGRVMHDLREVTPADVQRVARRYMHDFRFGFVGDTTKVPPILRRSF